MSDGASTRHRGVGTEINAFLKKTVCDQTFRIGKSGNFSRLLVMCD